MTGTRVATRLNKELACRADRLKTMMFNNNRFAGQQPEQQRSQGRTSNVNHVRGADHPQQLGKAGLPENTKWKQAIIKVFGRCLCYESEVKFSGTVRRAHLSETAGD